jgi:hypothetical protein
VVKRLSFTLLFFFLPALIFPKEIVLKNSKIQKAYKAKIIEINYQKNTIKTENSNNGTEQIFHLDNNRIKQLKKGEIVLIKPLFGNTGKSGCRCRGIRERIKKLVRKRRNILKTHKNIRHHRMFRSGRK